MQSMANNKDTHYEIKPTEYYLNALMNIRYRSVNHTKPNSVFLTIGEIPLHKMEEVFVVPLFGNRSEDYLKECLAGLGRYVF